MTGTASSPYAQALIAQAIQFSVLEDKGFTTGDIKTEAQGHGGLRAITWALAEYLGTDEGHAAELILAAQYPDD